MPRAILVVEPQGESKVLHEVAAHDEQQLQERLKANRTSCRSRISSWRAR